jgi:DNA-binding MarR family transcriptional regulator
VSSERAKLVEEILLKSRELSTETIMFHTAIADQRGLSAVESKVMDYLVRLGPQTPKDLAHLSGLAPASVTALIDRLEKKDLVARKPHPDDRRRVLIEMDMAGVAESAPMWDHLVRSTQEHLEHYTDEQLRTIIEWVAAAAVITHESTAKLRDPSKE